MLRKLLRAINAIRAVWPQAVFFWKYTGILQGMARKGGDLDIRIGLPNGRVYEQKIIVPPGLNYMEVCDYVDTATRNVKGEVERLMAMEPV